MTGETGEVAPLEHCDLNLVQLGAEPETSGSSIIPRCPLPCPSSPHNWGCQHINLIRNLASTSTNRRNTLNLLILTLRFCWNLKQTLIRPVLGYLDRKTMRCLFVYQLKLVSVGVRSGLSDLSVLIRSDAMPFRETRDACIVEERQYRAPHLFAGLLLAAMSRVDSYHMS
ncbi:hypothetical protein F511_30851 [Dorcoceras hygrometricum]|uniref:Uncharacterized protein n=1 Tax=Dorcoceras hygrometricum TaxID=472368 RepID=A0A2Z7B5Q9_9LAMI|nr:hypothetical protein F511_30851 [Dorcoceras hygrometricum]